MYPPHYLGYHSRHQTIKTVDISETFFLAFAHFCRRSWDSIVHTPGRIYISQGTA
jgi:hypothetical protein